MSSKVASISFNSNHSLSMDVEGITKITMSQPMQMDDGTWFCELILRSVNGTVAVQLLAETQERFKIEQC